MRDIMCASIGLLLDQQEKCSIDEHGFVQNIHVSWFDNLRIEFEHHCRKCRTRPKPPAKRKKVEGRGTEPPVA
jgi:hypothetical protein